MSKTTTTPTTTPRLRGQRPDTDEGDDDDKDSDDNDCDNDYDNDNDNSFCIACAWSQHTVQVKIEAMLTFRYSGRVPATTGVPPLHRAFPRNNGCSP